MPKSVADLRIDLPFDSGLRRSSGRSSSSSGGSGGGSVTYFAGDAIDISVARYISVKLESAGAITIGAGGGLQVNPGDGVKITSNQLTLNLASTPALEYGSGGDAGKVQVKVSNGISRGASGLTIVRQSPSGLDLSGSGLAVDDSLAGNGLGITSKVMTVKVPSPSGLTVDSSGVYVADSIAGAGLAISSKVLAVGDGDGIDVFADSVAVDVTDIIDTAAGLKEDASNNIQIRLETNSGLQFGGAGGVQLGTPSTLSVSSTATVSGANHNHPIASSSDVGTSPAASILASNGSGQLTLAQLTLKGNLVFSGADRNINASNSLYLTPTTDLILDPGGLVLAPNAQELRTSTINDLPTGIDGWRLWNRYANYQQLTIGAIKADELYVRVFTADETRIDRGEEYWSKSFGIVQEDFTLPAINSTVDAWFEDAPAATSFNLFSVNDYLLMRTIDWSTGLVVQKIWWQVTTSKLAQETTAVNGVDRQQWRIKRIAGGTTGTLIKRGNLALDTGQVGQGWVHLSALSQDGGPFIQIGAMTSISTVPQFTNYVRMGNLNGTVDYSGDIFGFAAGSGNGGLGTTPSAGFSGMAAEATNGLRLFNTSLYLYDSSILELVLSKDLGLRMLEANSNVFANRKYLGWFSDVTNTDLSDLTAHLTSASASGSGTHFVRMMKNAHATLSDDNALWLQVQTNDPTSTTPTGPRLLIWRKGDGTTFTQHEADYHTFIGKGFISPSSVGTHYPASPVSMLHVYESTNASGSSAGVTIEQDGTGDALLQLYISAARRWVIGIDNSDGDKLKISNNAALGSADVFTIDTSNIVYFPGSNVFIGATADTTPSSRLYVTKTINNIGADHRGATIESRTTGTNSAFNVTGLAIITNPGGSSVASVTEIGLDVTVRGVQSSGRPIAGRFTNGDLLVSERGLFGSTSVTPASPLHVYQSDTATTTAVGLTIEQGSIGDAKLQWLLTGGQRWGMGIDNSLSGDPLVVAAGTDLSSGLLYFTTGGNMGLGESAPSPFAGSYTGRIFQVTSGSTAALILKAAGASPTLGAVIDLVYSPSSPDHKWSRIVNKSAFTQINIVDDSGSDLFNPFAISHSTGYIGINKTSSTTFDAQLDIEGYLSNSVQATTYGADYYQMIMRRANTTPGSPSSVSSGQLLGGISFYGYTSGGWAAIQSAEIDVVSTETYNTGTTGKAGAKMVFAVRGNGASNAGRAMTIEQDANITFTIAPYNKTVGATNRPLYIDNTGVIGGVIPSSLRYKTAIRSLLDSEIYGDAFIERINPVLYKYKADPAGTDQLGFIAEHIDHLGAKELVVYTSKGVPESVNYERFVVPLAASAQRHQRRIAELEARVLDLERRLAA